MCVHICIQFLNIAHAATKIHRVCKNHSQFFGSYFLQTILSLTVLMRCLFIFLLSLSPFRTPLHTPGQITNFSGWNNDFKITLGGGDGSGPEMAKWKYPPMTKNDLLTPRMYNSKTKIRNDEEPQVLMLVLLVVVAFSGSCAALRNQCCTL